MKYNKKVTFSYRGVVRNLLSVGGHAGVCGPEILRGIQLETKVYVGFKNMRIRIPNKQHFAQFQSIGRQNFFGTTMGAHAPMSPPLVTPLFS